MADFGLIGAIGEGLSKGVDAYQKQKKSNFEQEKYEQGLIDKRREEGQKLQDRQAEREYKKVYYDYLMKKAQGKDGAGGKVKGMIDLAKAGLKGEWDEQGNLVGVSRDEGLPLPGRGGKDYKGELGLIEEKNKGAEKLARIRSEAEKYGKETPEQRYQREMGLVGAKTQSAQSIADANILSKNRNSDIQNQTRSHIAELNASTKDLPSDRYDREQMKLDAAAERNRYSVDNKPKPYGMNQGWREDAAKRAGQTKQMQEIAKMRTKGFLPIVDAESGMVVDWKPDPNYKPPVKTGKTSVGGKAPQQSAGERKASQDYAKQVVEWDTGGRQTMAEAVERLEEAAHILQTEKNVTGSAWQKLTPNSLRGIVNPRSQIVKDSIDNANNATLRATLGAQFTQKEGEQVRGQQFNDKLDQKEALNRVQRQLRHMRKRIALGDALSAHLKANKYDASSFPIQQYSSDVSPEAFAPVTKNPKEPKQMKVPGAVRSEYSPSRKKTRFLDAQGKVLKILDGDQR